MIRLRAKSGRFISIQQAIDKLENPAQFLDKVGQMLQASTQARISTTKTSPNGVPFTPWALGTALARQRKGNAARGILYDTGNLLNSISYQVIGKQVQVGVTTAAPYGTYLQNGTRHMPARPFVGISEQDREMVRVLLQTYLKQV